MKSLQFTPVKESMIPMAHELRARYQKQPSQELIETIVCLARAWNRYDVWQCIFEKHIDVYKALRKDEIYAHAARSACNYCSALKQSEYAAQAVMSVVRFFPDAYSYPDIYTEVFAHYGIVGFYTHRVFDEPLVIDYDHGYQIALNGVWNEGTEEMFFTGKFANESFESDAFGEKRLRMWFATSLNWPEKYQDLVRFPEHVGVDHME